MKEKKTSLFSSKKEILNFIIGLIIIGISIYAFIKLGISLINAVKLVIDNYPTISVAVITGLLALISAITGKFLENRYTIKNQIRKERQDMYIGFLDWLIRNVLYDEISSNKDIIDEIKEQQKNITLYASDKVLKAWSVFRSVAINSEQNKKGLSKEEQTKYYLKNEAPHIENLIFAIRKELGYKNKNIKQYDILRLYINDINKYIKD